MAREAYRSLYGDLDKLKDLSLLDDPAGGTTVDDELWQLLMAVSQWIDDYCNRFFYPFTTTRYFDLDEGAMELAVPDLIAVTTLKDDQNQDATYENTWASTAYQLHPSSAEPTKLNGQPYSSIKVNTRSNDTTRSQFPPGQRVIEIAGKWGWREFLEDSGSNPTAQQSSSSTTLAATAGTDFQIGQTVLVDSEQQLITNIAANNLTTRRALNGTTAAVHETTADIYIVRWPLPIERAALIQAARIWNRAPAFEPFYVDADLDTDVRMLLEAYRKVAA